MSIFLKTLTTICFLITTVSFASPCENANNWIRSKDHSRVIQDQWTYAGKTMACKADDKTNMRMPDILCSVECGFSKHAMVVHVYGAIYNKKTNLYHIRQDKIKKCSTTDCFINTCHHFFLDFKLKKHCAMVYQEALSQSNDAKKHK